MEDNIMDQVYEKYYKDLYLYALSLCHNEEMAKDLVSETFYKAFISSNQPIDSFKFWLFRVLKNQFIDEKRKDSRLVALDYYEGFLSDKSAHEPSKTYLKRERNQKLYEQLIKLEPLVYREVIYLYYFVEISIKDIALIINRSESHTRSSLYRARKKLRKALEEDLYEF